MGKQIQVERLDKGKIFGIGIDFSIGSDIGVGIGTGNGTVGINIVGIDIGICIDIDIGIYIGIDFAIDIGIGVKMHFWHIFSHHKAGFISDRVKGGGVGAMKDDLA